MKYFKITFVVVLCLLTIGMALFPTQGFTFDVTAASLNAPMIIYPDSEPESDVPLSSVAEDAAPFVPPTSMPDEFVPGEMLIKFKDNIKPDHPDLSNLKHEFDAEFKHTHGAIGVHLFKLKAANDKAGTIKAIEKVSETSARRVCRT